MCSSDLVVIFAMGALALLLRSKVMGFGLLWFIVTITPVALITPRPGYVIYVPAVGFGLYFGEFINIFVQKVADSKRTPAIRFAAFLLVALAGAAWHRAHWPATVPANKQAYFQLADQFQREYPSMKGGAKILFASDFFPPDVWDMTMMLRLLYRDKLLDVRRLHAAPEMQPAKGEPRKFDYVFATAGSHYEELENRNIEESMRLHLLRNYTVGRKTSFGKDRKSTRLNSSH